MNPKCENCDGSFWKKPLMAEIPPPTEKEINDFYAEIEKRRLAQCSLCGHLQLLMD